MTTSDVEMNNCPEERYGLVWLVGIGQVSEFFASKEIDKPGEFSQFLH